MFDPRYSLYRGSNIMKSTTDLILGSCQANLSEFLLNDLLKNIVTKNRKFLDDFTVINLIK
ncbi:hypothetical protein NIES2107_72830 (plasmid) [Nostoc carneum NIES-2107]|nr:hypothetical protein NIES2107_72830 [Nostoc carneum NIES-2107]